LPSAAPPHVQNPAPSATHEQAPSLHQHACLQPGFPAPALCNLSSHRARRRHRVRNLHLLGSGAPTKLVWSRRCAQHRRLVPSKVIDLVRESPPQLIKAHASTAQSVSSNADANHARRDCELPSTIPVGRPSPSSTSAHCGPAHRTRVLVSTIGVANCTVCNIYPANKRASTCEAQILTCDHCPPANGTQASPCALALLKSAASWLTSASAVSLASSCAMVRSHCAASAHTSSRACTAGRHHISALKRPPSAQPSSSSAAPCPYLPTPHAAPRWPIVRPRAPSPQHTDNTSPCGTPTSFRRCHTNSPRFGWAVSEAVRHTTGVKSSVGATAVP
jgi:hypothetical protein